MLKSNSPLFLVVDLFCGAGGTSTGFAMAKDNLSKVIYCVNHDNDAIESHKANHPDCIHAIEDVRTINILKIKKVVDKYRKKYPSAFLILFGSFPCPHFSKARGCKPKDDEMRTMANSLFMKWDLINKIHYEGDSYIQILKPDYIWFENVEEFISWGPLNDDGKPIKNQMGSDFYHWQNGIKSLGYDAKWNKFNSADYGAHTSRLRLFGCFAKDKLPIVWPEPTHAKNPKPGSGMMKHMPAKSHIDFNDTGSSIFDKKYVESTLKRILSGLIKFIAKEKESIFISKYYSGHPSSKNISVNSPIGTITAVDHHSLVTPVSLIKYNSINKKTGAYVPPSLDEPCPTIATQNRLGFISCESFISAYYGNGFNTSVDEPCPTLRTKDHLSIVNVEDFFIDKHYGNKSQNQSINEPLGTIVGNDKHRLIKTESFIYNPSYGGHFTDANNPCPVIVARQDKAPLHIVVCNEGVMGVPIYEDDSETMVRIKLFMVLYKISDIRIRMLREDELLKLQGFPSDYKLIGNKTKKKLLIGNSVVPIFIKAWVEAFQDYFIYKLKYKVA